jgi:hypothetical protein
VEGAELAGVGVGFAFLKLIVKAGGDGSCGFSAGFWLGITLRRPIGWLVIAGDAVIGAGVGSGLCSAGWLCVVGDEVSSNDSGLGGNFGAFLFFKEASPMPIPGIAIPPIPKYILRTLYY